MSLTPATLQLIKRFEAMIVPAVIKYGSGMKDVYYNPGKLKVAAKGDWNLFGNMDVVTDLDNDIEEKLHGQISKEFPEFGFLVEEHEEWNDKSPDFVCSIDPVDGTKYLVRGIPLFSSQVALLYQGEPVLGLVYNPITEELYLGSECTPANLNGRQIKVSQVQTLNEAFVAAGCAPRRANWEHDKDWMVKKLAVLMLTCQRLRVMGAGGLTGAWVAAGGLDAYVNLSVDSPQDVFPAVALVKYAGGVVEYFDIPGMDQARFVIGNQKLVSLLKKFLLD